MTWLDLFRTSITDLTPLAGRTALQELALDGTPASDLSPLASLAALKILSIPPTQVTDLNALAGLTNLQTLWLGNTEVADLRPIRDLPQLGVEKYSGLNFDHTPFAEATDETRRLAAIQNDQQRTRETLAFLKTLAPCPEPLPWEVDAVQGAVDSGAPVIPPEQDTALSLVWGERGFGFLVSHIGLDPVTQGVLAELRDLLDTLIRQSGNSHEDVHRLASEMRARCEPVNGSLNALRLHLSFQKLERLHAGRDRRERRLDDEIVTTLDSILITAPGATLGDAQVQDLIRRQDTNRAAPLPPLDAARADAVLAAVAAPDAPFDDAVQELIVAAQGGGRDDRLRAAGGILAGNVVVVVGRKLLALKQDLLVGAGGGLLGNWVGANAGAIRAYALSMGTDAAVWLARILREVGKGGSPL